MYLCYDVKGIQNFIFSVPKLKCIVGGSSLIAALDEWAQQLANADVETIFSGGGRGVFQCKDEASANQLKQKLLKKAHDAALDIRFGVAPRLCDAVQGAEELYPYCAEDVEPIRKPKT